MLNKKILLYLVGIFTLIIGFFYNENSSGGAEYDHNYLIPFIESFSKDFKNGLNFFISDSGSLIHSPFFYILTGGALSVFGNLNIVKIIYILISSTLPLIFYKILKLQKKDNIFLYLFSLIIFTSPYFRSSSIWLLGDNLSLIFFGLSVLFYLKINKKNFLFYSCLSILFLALCCYIRYYYFPFYFFYIFTISKKSNLKEITKIVLFSFLISLPAIIYFINIIKYHNFFRFLDIEHGHSLQNYSTNFLVILTIILFYLLPFLPVFYKNMINYYLSEKKRLYLILLIFLLYYFIDLFFLDNFIFFREFGIGGGIIKKTLDLMFFNSEILIIFSALISILILDFIFSHQRSHNYTLLFCLVLSMPFIYVFQKYLDPLFYFLFFGLIKSPNVDLIIIKLKQYIYFYYSYFLFFLFITLIVY